MIASEYAAHFLCYQSYLLFGIFSVNWFSGGLFVYTLLQTTCPFTIEILAVEMCEKLNAVRVNLTRKKNHVLLLFRRGKREYVFVSAFIDFVMTECNTGNGDQRNRAHL